MATLVLTAVGTALGGPIGGALGALAGNAIDHDVLFRPKGREGARLSDLRVQTSSYGSPIPRLFGTMRVAGTVIWATDLIESRSMAGGGKGRPSETSYSYAASFAVLLSGRPVLDVGRIWADGQLLRGAAGDWKAATGFRLHAGGEDQAADPLIASAEGAGLTPAHRGCAYAVFEQLQLESFGNRIPSLSFEVIADAGAVSVGAIARALAPEVSGAPALALDGFAAADGSVRTALETLAAASGAWFAGLEMRDAAPAAVAVTPDPARETRDVAAADAAPARVTAGYYEPARDWQAGLQQARRPGEGATLALELPAALSADAAKGIAAAALARGEAGRVKRTVTTPLDALAIVPGDAVSVAGEAGTWRVDAVALDGPSASTGAGMAVTLELTPLTPAPLPMAASGGRALPAPDRLAGTTLLHAAELPALEDALLTQPRLTVLASGTGAGWRSAALLYSLDGGASWIAAGGTAAPAVIGTVATPPAPAPTTLADRRDALVVTLARADMALSDADAAGLDGGANLALVGDELLQFGRAEPLGGGRWRLGELWRGRRGTDGAAAIAAGNRFVLVERDAARAIDLPLTALGGEVRVMATGVGDAEPVIVTAPLTGASVTPPAPVALRRDGDGVGWTRRSRAGWRWLDRVDVPLGEEREAYRVTVASGGVAREAVVDAPFIALTAAERDAGATVTVRQRGTYGESSPAILEGEAER
ncbi:phage tail protein [uncultured Sphingomonas sp.]|uniref:GTA baseplate fiber-binding domain-containing protein n=1 Tax=uncultured Sphingomonas sp. TaxID=158754 RepID=UPI0035CC0349